jgi:hypothetical protein
MSKGSSNEYKKYLWNNDIVWHINYMYTKDQLKRLIFIDIETSSGYNDYATLSTRHPKEIKFCIR